MTAIAAEVRKTMRYHSRSLLALAAALALASLASAQSAQRITPNFKDADITQVIEAVSAATGKNIIIDPRVRAQVTMLSSTPMSPEAFYQSFLALLQVHGFVAVPSGNVIKIVPEANARTGPGLDLPDHVSATSDEIVTQVIEVHNVSAAQLVPVLRPLIPQFGHLVAYPSSNILIISDRANNVNRLIRIIRRIDQSTDSDVDIVQLQNASANEVMRVVAALTQAQSQGDSGAPATKVIADDRSNSILLAGGDKAQRLRTKALIAHLDTPLANGGDTQVRYLRYADAEKIAGKLKEQATALTAPGGAAATPGAAAGSGGGVTIWADAHTNALVMTAPPKAMRSLMQVIDKLDIRREQVLVEAIIVEVSGDKSAELGVNWVLQGSKGKPNVPVAGFVSPVGGSSIIDLLGGVKNPTTLAASPPSGTTIGIGRLQNTGVNFGAVLRALQGDATTNIIATPSILTMDNQEAQIKVAQEVPFLTGQYANTGTTGSTTSSVTPFQTIQRQEVGTILKITPQINVDGQVLLKISQESSSLAGSAAAGASLTSITNKRTIDTTVLIEDGGTIVLGGLIQDTQTTGEQRVPFLGRIPLIGELFRTRSAAKNKTNLMVFIQPRILHNSAEGAVETNSKYEYMRDQQRMIGPHGEILPLLPGMRRSLLPPLQEPMPKPTVPAPPPAPAASAPAPVSLPPSTPAAPAPAKPSGGGTP